MTTIHSDVAAAVGNTPLFKLIAASKATGCEIFGKAEFMNPGQSVKAVSYTHLTLPTILLV